MWFLIVDTVISMCSNFSLKEGNEITGKTQMKGYCSKILTELFDDMNKSISVENVFKVKKMSHYDANFPENSIIP